MGEIADLMLDGDICEVCGVELSEGNGYPQLCEACKTYHWEMNDC